MTTKNDGLISNIEECISKNPQTKEVARRARNLFDDAYGRVSHAGSQINTYLDNLPKSGEMSPTAKALKTEFEKNYKTAQQVGTVIGNDFRTYGVPMLRDGIVAIQNDPVLLSTAVFTTGCLGVAVATKSPWFLGAATAGVVFGELYTVAKPIVDQVNSTK